MMHLARLMMRTMLSATSFCGFKAASLQMVAISLGLLALLAPRALAVDYIWTNATASGLYTNLDSIWNQTATTPAEADSISFTNGSAYTVFFSNTAPLFVESVFFTNNAAGISMSVTQSIGAGQTWSVVNQYFVGAAVSANRTNLSVLSSGTLAVTNGPGTGTILIGNGSGGIGRLVLAGGNLLADRLIVTNNTATATNALFTFSGGTLTTSNAASAVAADFRVVSNTTFNVNGVWNMNGGTNNISSVASGGARGTVALGNGVSNAAVNVSTDALWNLGGLSLTIGSVASTGTALSVIGGTVTNVSSLLLGGTGAHGNQLILTNGGKLVTGSWAIGGSSGLIVGNNNLVLVGSNSVLSSAAQNQIGQGGAGNRLIITNGGFVSSTGGSDILVIGAGATGTNNSMLVTGTGSAFTNSSRIHLGGASNYMVIEDGGWVQSSNAYLGNGNSSNNWVLVTGAGSLWNILGSGATTFVGNGGTNTALIIVAGGTVNSAGTISIGAAANSQNNSLTISNGGKLVTTGALIVGGAAGANSNRYNVGGLGLVSYATNGLITVGSLGGSFNTMTVTNASIQSAGLFIGNGVSNNTVTVQDGVTWNMLGQLSFGRGTGNVLIVDSATSVVNAGGLGLLGNGLTFSLTNNILTGTGLNVMSARVSLVGGSITLAGLGNNTLTFSNQLYTSSGPSLIGNGSSNNVLTVLADTVWNGGGANLTNGFGAAVNNVLINSGGSMTNFGTVIIGASAGSVSNGIVINNGGTFTSGNLTVGSVLGATNNYYNIGGVGGVTTVSNGLITIGSTAATTLNGGGFNTMIVTNANLWSTGLVMGNKSSSNTVTVLAGTVWDGRAGVLIIGTNSGGGTSPFATTMNVLTNDGGQMLNFGAVTIGAGGGGGQNNGLFVMNGGVVVSGGGLTVGTAGTADGRLWIASSGTVVNVAASLAGSRGVVTVTDSGSTWTNTGLLTVGSGSNSKFNQLIISNGAQVISAGAAIGSGTFTSNNLVTVIGSGSTWSNAGGTTIGVSAGGPSANNQLLVVGSGTVVSVGTTLIGSGIGASNNLVTITDPGSTWTNTGAITLYDVGNFLVVSNGGKVFQLGNSSTLTIGSNGRSNLLLIASSGVVVSANASLGLSTGNNPGNSRIIVTDPGSIWSNTVSLNFAGGSGHQLIVSNGGRVVVGGGINLNGAVQQMWIGSSGTVVSASVVLGNLSTVTITDPGSVWTNTGVLNVGATSGGANINQLIVTNGAGLFNGGAFNVGATANASNNSVRVLDGGLLEANTLSVGYAAGNTLSNRSGIFQFTTAAPSVSTAGVAIDSGVISFRAVTNANVWGNWAGTRGNQLANMSFAGANTFRLNAATNRLEAIGGVDQSYTFNTGLGATNYTRLEMINGQTAYRNGNVTIGAGGSFLASNTLATITGSFTNIGSADIVDATVDFQSELHVAGTLTLRSGIVTGAGPKTVSGTLRGNGTISGSISVAGNVNPGLSIGTLTFSTDLILTGTFNAQLDGTATGSADQLIVIGNLTLGGATLNLSELVTADDDAYVIVTYGSLSGDEIFTTVLGLPTGYHLEYNYNSLNQIAVVVPEPGPLVLVGLGIVALLGLGRFRRQFPR